MLPQIPHIRVSYCSTPCPGLKAERAQFPEVSRALEKVATERGLQLHQNWLNKCIQLYETYLVGCGPKMCVISLQGCLVMGWL